MSPKNTSFFVLAVIITLTLTGTSVFAAKLYLNGVEITDVKNKTFTKVKAVKVDKKGNIHIDAPQYEVKVLETGDSQSGQSSISGSENFANLSEKYYIATKGEGHRAQYKLIVKINGIQRLVIPPQNSSVIEEITGWLKKGKNTIHIAAEKKIGPEGRLSNAKSDQLELLIGKGHEEKKIVKIDSLKAKFQCDASRTNSYTKEYILRTK